MSERFADWLSCRGPLDGLFGGVRAPAELNRRVAREASNDKLRRFVARAVKIDAERVEIVRGRDRADWEAWILGPIGDSEREALKANKIAHKLR